MFRQLCVLALYAAALPMVAFAAPVEKNTPAQTGAFLAFCKSNDDGCISEVSDVSFAMMVQDRSWCPTSETDDVKGLRPGRRQGNGQDHGRELYGYDGYGYEEGAYAPIFCFIALARP